MSICPATVELIAKLILNPVDYLSPVLVRNEILGIRLPGKSGGHDNWGFRNAKVPETAEIVALGDSHTYGNTARMNEAWPKVLAPPNDYTRLCGCTLVITYPKSFGKSLGGRNGRHCRGA